MIGIIVNTGKPEAEEALKELTDALNMQNVLFRIFRNAPELADEPEGVSSLITIGGDGTLLRTAETAALNGIPVFGINVGRIGFLTEAKTGEIGNIVRRFLGKDYVTESRMMLECSVNGVSVSHCLNDILVSKGSLYGVTQMEILVDGTSIGQVFCDGMLASTPTGSTAYTISAGGPVLNPDVEAFAITPICSHTMYILPFVVGKDSEICFVMKDNGTILSDGTKVAELKTGDIVSVRKSPYALDLIRFERTNVMNLIHNKLC